MTKKSFFYEPSVERIARRDAIISTQDYTQELMNLQENQYLLISFPLLPTHFEKEPRKFLKHGKEINIHRYGTIYQAERGKTTPLDLRRKAYSESKEAEYSCYSFNPLIGNDKRRRKVSLVQILEGARLFAYSEQVEGTRIKIKQYDDARRVSLEGAEVVVEVPSAERKSRRQKIKFSSVPVVDNSRKYAIAHSLGTDHTCEFKRYRGMRYTWENEKENSKIINFCKHEVAGWYGLIDYYWNENHNIRPLEMSQIALPSKKIVELYKRMLDSVIIHDSSIKKKKHLRKPNQAEKQILLDKAIRTLGHDETLFCDSRRDGLLSQYDWSLRG